MKVTFIQPSVGNINRNEYPRAWCMEPLSIAMLSAITPNWVEKEFYDDRLEDIPYHKTDLVAITVETYTAKRSYEIAAVYKSLNIPVVMGGFHATLVTDEVKEHADAVVVGEAELTWPKLLNDFKENKLQKVYTNKEQNIIDGIIPDRSLYKGKDYLKLGLIETSRGCNYSCEFCSIYGYYNKSFRNRPVKDIVEDIKQSGKKYFFFVDDNVAMDKKNILELCKALKPLKIKWFSQVSIHISKDDEILQALKDAGCLGALIGFESFNEDNLKQMGKNINMLHADYEKAIKKIKSYGLIIYGTFVFGYKNDCREDFEKVFKFAEKNKMYLTAFNHLVPFPGTPLYDRIKEEGRFIDEKWWLSDKYKFGDVAFNPGTLNAKELEELCYQYRKKFYKLKSILKRCLDFKANLGNFKNAFVFFYSNLSSRKDIDFRQGLPLGKAEKKDEV